MLSPHRPRQLQRALARRMGLIRAASHAGFKSIPRQLCEINRLRFGPTRMNALEYHALRLYDAGFHPGARLGDYGGKWLKEWIHARLNTLRWEAMATDKAIMYALFDQFGLPHPEVCALATPSARRYSDRPVIASRDDLARYLRHQAPYPLFLKPIKGSRAAGSRRIEAYHHEDDSLSLNHGQRLPLNRFVDSLEDPTGFGLLLQRAAHTSAALRPICGPAVTGCRIIMLLHDDGARALCANWKLPAGGNHVDNFCGGHSGNLIAGINPVSGRVERVVRGAGLQMKLDPVHPDTGADLLGLELPGWQEMLALVTRAAECFPGFRWQHWDAGFTDQGPVLFEMNSAGDIDGMQLAHGRGILGEELRAFLARYGDRPRRGGKLFPERPAVSTGRAHGPPVSA